MNVLLVGLGKMGKAIERVSRDRGHVVVGHVGKPQSCDPSPQSHREPTTEFDGLDAYFAETQPSDRADVALEFSVPSSAPRNVLTLIEAGIPTVCGTTGWDAEGMRGIADRIGTPYLYAANFSMGIAVVRHILQTATRLLAPLGSFQPAIVERHHRMKLDRPSGTANVLARTIAEAGGPESIEIVSLRQGGVPGEHTVIFEGEEESLEITHRARSRGIFATGAVLAAEWIAAERPRGSVNLDDFLERTSTWNVV